MHRVASGVGDSQGRERRGAACSQDHRVRVERGFYNVVTATAGGYRPALFPYSTTPCDRIAVVVI